MYVVNKKEKSLIARVQDTIAQAAENLEANSIASAEATEANRVVVKRDDTRRVAETTAAAPTTDPSTAYAQVSNLVARHAAAASSAPAATVTPTPASSGLRSDLGLTMARIPITV